MSGSEILDLMRHTDTVAEVQNTLRQGMPVTLASVEAVSVQRASGAVAQA